MIVLDRARGEYVKLLKIAGIAQWQCVGLPNLRSEFKSRYPLNDEI